MNFAWAGKHYLIMFLKKEYAVFLNDNLNFKTF